MDARPPDNPKHHNAPSVSLRLQLSQADQLVKQLVNPLLNVTRVSEVVAGPYHGCHELRIDRTPNVLYAKLASVAEAADLQAQSDVLMLYRAHHALPVPDVMGFMPAGEGRGYATMLMGAMPGASVDLAELSPAGRVVFETELARSLVYLHGHGGPYFGAASPSEGGSASWIAAYKPEAVATLEVGRHLLDSAARDAIDHVIDHFDHWLANTSQPALVHGNLTASNILIDDASEDEPRLLGFLNPRGLYADAEYELAKLQFQGLIGEVFYRVYGEARPIDAGYARRCRVYEFIEALNGLIHQGERFMPVCERLIGELRSFTQS